MESASGSITLKKATRKDIKEITELIYISETILLILLLIKLNPKLS